MEFLTDKKILVVGAHPDDEVLGVGGTITLAVEESSQVDVLIVTDGVSAQYKGQQNMAERRESHLEDCCKKLGVANVTQWEFPDMRLDSISQIELNTAFESYFLEHQYDVVFVHHPYDINKDHQVTFESLMVALRPVPGREVSYILTYYTPSSSEWSAHSRENIFCPNLYVDISETLDKKIDALGMYEDEMRPYPHPRSFENVMNLAKVYGSQVGLRAAEPFCLIRGVLK